MKICKTKQQDVIICNIDGDVDIDSSPELRKTFNELIADKAKKIVLNLAKVSYIDSSGLATFVEFLKLAKGYGGDIRLANLTEKVKGLFEITKLDRIFKVYSTPEEAVGDFNR